jgi:flagellar basal body-associated protein FliL
MAKKKSGDEEAPKGGGKKKIIIIVVALVGAFGAKTMLMKPPSAAEQAAAKLQAEQDLTALCQRQNAPESPAADEHAAETTPTTAAGAAAATPTTEAIDPHAERGGVLELDPLTVNLADGHYLKVGLALQLDKATVVETAKDEGLGAKALDMAIAALSPKTMDELGQSKVRDQLKQELGTDACHAYEGEVLTVYFTNFVMQ